MKYLPLISSLLGMFIMIIIMDYVWLGIITKEFIINQFGSLVKVKDGAIEVKLLIGLLTWFIIALGCLIFVVYPSETLIMAIIMGAVFGFIAYAIYDLTNLTFIVNYPVKFVIVDIIWGTVLCGAISTVGFLIKNSLGGF